ncbi:MAG: fibrobacter succinogenes major paralogous domain-containing protein [Bacteroidetes bacterium]|nr:fibrobacter succinogenes major paralogous domain-containing protein [Bacteroidota bacterium]
MRRILLLSTLACLAGALSAQTSCPNPYDGNGDGAVTINDLLDLLGLFGDADTDQDGIWDSVDACVDTGACNYSAEPTEPCAYIDVLGICGGGCEGDGDGDGICDDVDTCVGDLDECGVCNGPGPIEIVIESITILYDSVFLPQLGEWYVYEYGADTTFTNTCAPYFGDFGDPVSYQGYDYATVLIGDQCWFAENLRSENYENGDAIPSNLSDSEWQNTTSGAVAVYGEGSSTCYNYSPDGDACDEAWSLNEYGRLYNWYAVDDARGLCPSGWHVPTDGEWTVMTDFLGGESVVGGQMKTDYGWYNGGNGTNSSGFSGLPGCFRSSVGYFDFAGYYGYWWSSSPNGSGAWDRGLLYDLAVVYRNVNPQRTGFSVRCVRDAE